MDTPSELPHRLVDKVLNGIADAAESAGQGLSSGLDSLPLKEKGPHRAIDRALDGVVETPKALGKGLASALDHPFDSLK